MSDFKDSPSAPDTPNTSANSADTTDSGRRRALKTTAAAGGAFLAGRNLPSEWTTPVVESVLLPAHAQTTEDEENGGGGSGGGGVVGGFAFLDVPGGSILDYFAQPAHASDNCGTDIPGSDSPCCLETFGELNGPYQFRWQGVTVNGTTDGVGNMSNENFGFSGFNFTLFAGVAQANGAGNGSIVLTSAGSNEVEEGCVNQIVNWATQANEGCIV